MPHSALSAFATEPPEAFEMVDGKLYLNYNRDVQTQWHADRANAIEKGNAEWPRVESQATQKQ